MQSERQVRKAASPSRNFPTGTRWSTQSHGTKVRMAYDSSDTSRCTIDVAFRNRNTILWAVYASTTARIAFNHATVSRKMVCQSRMIMTTTTTTTTSTMVTITNQVNTSLTTKTRDWHTDCKIENGFHRNVIP
jgi:hypothetical protein